MRNPCLTLTYLLPLLNVLVQARNAMRGGASSAPRSAIVPTSGVSNDPNALETQINGKAINNANVNSPTMAESEDVWMWDYGQPPLFTSSITDKRGSHRTLVTYNDSDGNITTGTAFTTTVTANQRGYRFAILPLTIGGRYGTMITQGCREAAGRLEHQLQVPATCDAYGSLSDRNASDMFYVQNKSLHEMLTNASSGDANTYYNRYDAIAVAPAFLPDLIRPLLERAMTLGIEVVTLDTDIPDIPRKAFVASNNTFLGAQLAKTLNQLQPQGGTFAAIWPPIGLSFRNRLEGFCNLLLNESDGVWTEFPNSPAEALTAMEFIVQAESLASQPEPPTAIAILVYPPFDLEEYEALVDRHRHKNITWVGIGGSDRQMNLLSRKYVHGLVSQMHFEMGYISLENMATLAQGKPIEQEVRFTNVATHIQVPVVLPELVVNHNRVGDLAILGYAFFAITSLTALIFSCWVWSYRQSKVVKASQPKFLLMVAFGIIILSSAIIPLGMDDSHGRSDEHNVAICMSAPWLLCSGFAVAFSALFSKTSRINKIFQAGSQIRRIQVDTHTVMIQFGVLLGLNIIVLTCWTVIDPLMYSRVDNPGTDGWNRVIATRGTCQCNQMDPYVIPLLLINFSCLAVANWQAYQARFIESEFSEAKYIGIVCVSILQTALIGIPILLVVQDQPEALYLVLICMIFVVSMAVLLLIFVPKMVLMETYSRSCAKVKEQMMKEAIIKSSRRLSSTKASRKASGNFSMSSESFRDSWSQPMSLGSTNNPGCDGSNELESSHRLQMQEMVKGLNHNETQMTA